MLSDLYNLKISSEIFKYSDMEYGYFLSPSYGMSSACGQSRQSAESSQGPETWGTEYALTFLCKKNQYVMKYYKASNLSCLLT
jgi:hypothetical protein